MKIAAVSDIHGNLPALQAVAADIAREGVDVVVNLGDILSGPLLAAETADFVMARAWPTIAGNHERQLLKAYAKPAAERKPLDSDSQAAGQITQAHAAWLRTLPPTLRLADDVLLVHGTPASDLVYLTETVTGEFSSTGNAGIRVATADEIAARLGEVNASLVLCGHSHIPRLLQHGGTLIVNPGSVGVQGYDDDQPHYHVVQTGAPHARYAIVERAGGGWQVQLRAVAYDTAAMAGLAARNGRPEWAYALATGCMPPASWKIAP